jgi:hypothetical protein
LNSLPGNKIFVLEKITDFSRTPLEIPVKENVVKNGNYYYIEFHGVVNREAFKKYYPEQENGDPKYLLFMIEFADNRGYVKLPFKATINKDIVQQRIITPIKNKEGYIFHRVLIHFPYNIKDLVKNPEISVYVEKELKEINRF